MSALDAFKEAEAALEAAKLALTAKEPKAEEPEEEAAEVAVVAEVKHTSDILLGPTHVGE